MPRNIDPGNVLVGKGRAPQGTVEDNSLRTPNRDVQPLRAHVEDPSRAHFAVAIAIEDVANNFTSDNVEGALAELALGSGDVGRTAGVLAGCTYSTAALTLTMDGGSSILLNGQAADISGNAVALTNNATNYVYVDSGTGLLTASTTLPTLASAPVLIGVVVTLGGVATSEQDLRFFINDIDRKPPLTLRSDGVAANSTAEGAFQSLEAVFNYLNLYASAGTGDEVETHLILVRGTQTVTSTLDLPVPGTILQGDGEAIIVDATGGSVMFNLGTNTDRLQFRDLEFESNNAATVALQGNDPNDLIIERCNFSAGGANFALAIDLPNTVITGTQRLRIRDCLIRSDAGISIGRGTECRIIDSAIFGSGASSTGIVFGSVYNAGSVRNLIRGCRIQDYQVGISSILDHTSLVDTAITGCQTRAVELSGDFPSLQNVTIELDSVLGVGGIQFSGVADPRVLGCRITNPRTVWGGGDLPYGIQFTGPASTGGQIDDCLIEGFYNDSDDQGFGIQFQSQVTDTKVSNSTIRGAQYGVWGFSVAGTGKIFSNLTIQEVETGAQIYGAATQFVDSTITVDATRGQVGITLPSASSNNVKIRGCIIANPRDRTTYAADSPVGIFVGGADRVSVDNCEIQGFGSTTSTSIGISFQSGSNYGSVNGGFISGSLSSCIDFDAGTSFHTATGVRMVDAAAGVVMDGTDSVVEGCVMDLDDDDYSIFGVTVSGNRNKVIGNTMSLSRGTWSGETPFGIGLASGTVGNSVIGNTVNNFVNTTDGLGYGIYLVDNTTDATVDGNRIAGSFMNIRVEENCVSCVISNNICSGTETETLSGIYIVGTSGLMRSITVSGNHVDSFYEAGIRVAGRVQDVEISGNTVDGYLTSDPYNPTGVGIEVVPGFFANPTNVRTTGNTVLRCRNGIIYEGTSSEPISYGTISDNTVHDCGYAQDLSGGAPATFEGQGSKGIGACQCTGLNIANNQIFDIGQITDDAGTPGFPDLGAPTEDVQSVGITVLDCDKVSISDNRISNTLGNNLGAGNGIAVGQNANLTGSTNTRRQVHVLDNTINWDTTNPGTGAFVGISVGLVPTTTTGLNTQTLRDLKIEGNTIRNSGFTGVSINITDGCTLRNFSVSNNNFESAGIAGLLVAAASLSSGGARVTISEGALDGNAFADTSSTLLPGSGVDVSISATIDSDFYGITLCGGTHRNAFDEAIRIRPSFASCRMRSFQINGNNFRGGGSTAIEITTAAASVFEDFQVNSNSIRDVHSGIIFTDNNNAAFFAGLQVNDNLISGCTTGSPIAFNCLSTSSWTDLQAHNNMLTDFPVNTFGIVLFQVGSPTRSRNFSFCGNAIEGTTGGINSGIAVFCRVDTSGITINDNTIAGGLTPGFAGGRGIYLESTSGTANIDWSQVQICGNNVEMLDLGGGPAVEARIQGRMVNWKVDNNTLVASSIANNPIIIEVTWSGVAPNDTYCEGISITNNLLQGGADSRFDLNDTLKLREFKFDGNIVRDTVNIGFLFATEQSLAGSEPSILNASFNDNKFFTVGRQGLLLELNVGVGTGDTMRQIQLCRNQFFDCALQGGWVPTDVLSIETDAALEGLIVSENQFDGCGDSENADYGTINLLIGGSTGRNIDVSGNMIRICAGYAILIADNPVGVGEQLLNCTVSRNKIDQNGGLGGGIHIDMTPWNGCRNLHVTDNVLELVNNTVNDRGIHIVGPLLPSLNWTIARNHLDSVGGAPNLVGAGIYVQLNADHQNLDVMDNILMSVDGGALQIDVGTDLRGVRVTGNTITSATNTGLYVAGLGAVVSPIIEHLIVAGNVVRDAGDTAIRILGDDTTGDGTELYNTIVSDNIVSNAGGLGIWYTTDDSGGTSNDVTNLTMSGNTIEDSGGISNIYLDLDGSLLNSTVSSNTLNGGARGIYVLLDQDVENVTLANNTALGFSIEGIAVNTGGSGDNAINLTLIGNNLRSTVAGVDGYTFNGFGGTVRAFSMVGNSSNLASATGTTRNMIWEGIDGTNQQNMVFVGNNFRSSSDGIVATDPQFDPTGDNVVAANASNDTNDWASFAAEFTAVNTTGGNQT